MIETSDGSRKLEVRPKGACRPGLALRVDALIEVAPAVQSAVTRFGLALRGEATVRPGRPPRDVADLTRLEVAGLREGSTLLEFELAEDARPLDELDLGVQTLGASTFRLHGEQTE